MRSRLSSLLLSLALIATAAPITASASGRTVARHAISCAAVTLTLQPGIHPASPKAPLQRIAHDIPRRPVIVSLPVYANATPLAPFVDTPYEDYPADPYLQSAGAEWETADGLDAVQHTLIPALKACGWRSQGSWRGTIGAFTRGRFLYWHANRDLTLQVGFGTRAAGGTYIGSEVEAITLPKRPAGSYLHGPFTQMQLALTTPPTPDGLPGHVVHTILTNPAAIQRLVGAINAIQGRRTEFGLCTGGTNALGGPAKLTFVRPGGATVSVLERGPGTCGGGLSVNGIGWMIDWGGVWNQLLPLAGLKK